MFFFVGGGELPVIRIVTDWGLHWSNRTHGTGHVFGRAFGIAGTTFARSVRASCRLKNNSQPTFIHQLAGPEIHMGTSKDRSLSQYPQHGITLPMENPPKKETPNFLETTICILQS